MGILKKFYPDEYLDSTYIIDFKKYFEKGYRGIIFDIDNTLVPHGAIATTKANELFEKLRNIGFDTCLISNNKEKRVSSFANSVGSKYIFKASKPLPKNYKKACELMHTDIENTMFVGDQIFTDVYGAKRIGIYTILVKPIHPKEEIQIVLKRYLEKIVLRSYEKNK